MRCRASALLVRAESAAAAAVMQVSTMVATGGSAWRATHRKGGQSKKARGARGIGPEYAAHEIVSRKGNEGGGLTARQRGQAICAGRKDVEGRASQLEHGAAPERGQHAEGKRQGLRARRGGVLRRSVFGKRATANG